MKSKDAIDALGALASESRLAVFRLLVKRGPKGYTLSELVDRLYLPARSFSPSSVIVDQALRYQNANRDMEIADRRSTR